MVSFLTRTRGIGRMDFTDWVTVFYLFAAVLLMFGPILWVTLSSFKTEAALQEYPPTFLPLAPMTATVEGHDEPLQLFRVIRGEHEGRVLAQVRRIGIMSQMVDPADPATRIQVNIDDRVPEREFSLALENYTALFERFNFAL
jgi:alpha-1,4-digalacturonate transport system permease protein